MGLLTLLDNRVIIVPVDVSRETWIQATGRHICAAHNFDFFD